MIEIKLSYDRDLDQARENTRFWAPLALTAEQKHGLHDPIEMQRAGADLPIEQIASRWIVTDDPAEAVEQIKPYVQVGLNHLVFHAPGHDQSRFLESFSADVLPLLRKLGTD
jgi:coenzyme F420-dependent glucose-6-phosphate dehydrogenase